MDNAMGESFEDPTDPKIREHRNSPWSPSKLVRSNNQGLTNADIHPLTEAAARNEA